MSVPCFWSCNEAINYSMKLLFNTSMVFVFSLKLPPLICFSFSVRSRSATELNLLQRRHLTNISYSKIKALKRRQNWSTKQQKQTKLSQLSHNVMTILSIVVVKGVKSNPRGGTGCFSPHFKSIIPHPSLPILLVSSHLPPILSGRQLSVLHDDFRPF